MGRKNRNQNATLADFNPPQPMDNGYIPDRELLRG
jgi:hypothetical protein